jgi:TolA-binding protein
MFRIRQVALAAIVAATLAAPVAAQQQNYSQVTQADIQRLQDSVFQAGSEVQQLKSRDAARASQLQTQLDDLRDEVIYLKVKLRKEGTLQRTEYATVRDRVDDLRSQASNYTTTYTPSTASSTASAPTASAAGGTAPNRAAATSSAATQSSTSRSTTSSTTAAVAGSQVEVPSGTEIDVRLSNALNSGTAQVEDRFEGTTLVDLNINGRTVIPAGSVMRGVVTAVDPATRTNRTAKMTVSFDQVTINGRAYPIRGTVTQALQGEGIKGETGRIATGAGVGAVLGGILGGVKGAILGTVIGGGGITAATEGKEVEVPQGSVLRVRLDSPVQIAR